MMQSSWQSFGVKAKGMRTRIYQVLDRAPAVHDLLALAQQYGPASDVALKLMAIEAGASQAHATKRLKNGRTEEENVSRATIDG
jgi:hypothetical protein